MGRTLRCKLNGILIRLVFFVIPFAAAQAQPGVALIYSGPGVCEDGCVQAASEVAAMSGLEPRLVQGTELNSASTAADVSKLFDRAVVWIQPGGIGNYALWSMTARVRDELESFIKKGGGFVGFCAGAFMATEYIGRRGAYGFGIFPGTSIAYPYYPIRYDLAYTLSEVTWNGIKRSVFLEGGPYLIIPSGSKAEIIATYPSGAVATARTTYGKGRVYITGLHPEAPVIWTEEDNIKDPDGSDRDLAVEMVQWAAKTLP